MAETAPSRVEPSIGPTPVSGMTGHEFRAAAVASPAGVTPPPSGTASAEAPGPRTALDQLSRIEDKTARIEEKYARSEAILQRVGSTVEAATSRMNEVASQSELAALRSEVTTMAARVRGLPGKAALVAVAIVTSLLTAAIILGLIRYGLLQ